MNNFKKLLMVGPWCEMNDFANFNGYLHTIRNQYDEIIAAVPEKAIGAISEADKFLSISNEYLDKIGANYPQVLENQGTKAPIMTPNGPLIISSRNNSDFYQKVIDHVEENKLKYKDYEFKFFEQEVNLYTASATSCYTRLFNNLHAWLLDKKTIKPTEKVFNRIKEKYGHLFKEKTYILLTRNFKHKVPQDNTHIILPDLSKIVEYLTTNEIRIINIGFPPSNLDVENENYIEFNESLTQEELVAMMYLSDGLLLCGIGGGYTVHIGSNIDAFLIYEELWNIEILNLPIFAARQQNSLMISVDLTKEFKSFTNKDKILETLSNHKKKSDNSFSKEKEIIYLA